jgi:hypothetical protein
MADSLEIYGGTLTFDSRRHAYHFNGTPVPGCTTVLRRIGKGDTLIQWAANQAAEYVIASYRDGMGQGDVVRLANEAKLAWNATRREAADIGTEVHSYAEAILRGEPAPKLSTDEARQGAQAFERWLEEHYVKPQAIERRVFSKKHWYAGTTDLVAVIGRRLAIADFKTSSGIYPEYALQLSAYKGAWIEEHGLDPDVEIDRWIIRVDKKTGQFEARQFKRDQVHTRAFLHVLELHRCLQEMENTEETAAPKRKRKAA